MSFIFDLFEQTGSTIFSIWDYATKRNKVPRRGLTKQWLTLKLQQSARQLGFFSWLLGWNDTPRVAATTADASDMADGKKAPARRRLRAVPRVQSIRRRQQPEDDAAAIEAIETARVERQIEEDEQRAEAAMAASAGARVASASDAATSNGAAALEPTGYMVLALQEQMMQLKAQIAAMQNIPPPLPPRGEDDDVIGVYESAAPEELVVDDSAPPPPPPPPSPFKTPLLRRAVSAEFETSAVPPPPPPRVEASFSDLIRENLSSRLKETGVPRSPGGTPRRTQNETANDNSPGKFLASALRNKFKSVRMPLSPMRVNTAIDADDADWADENSAPPRAPAFSTPL